MITYTGIHVTREFGAPSLRDIAVQTMRLPRFCGAGDKFWPVGMHLMLVADLAPESIKHHALLHDAAEACVNDVPRPMKTQTAKELEARVTQRLYQLLGLKLPTPKEQVLIHAADMRAVNMEGCILGPRGFMYTQPNVDFDDSFYGDAEAFNLLHYYLERFTLEDAFNPDGKWANRLERRLRLAITKVHDSTKAAYRADYTKAA